MLVQVGLCILIRVRIAVGYLSSFFPLGRRLIFYGIGSR